MILRCNYHCFGLMVTRPGDYKSLAQLECVKDA